MTVLVVLVAGILLGRLAGMAGVRSLVARMVPDEVPFPMAVVYLTGVCEILGAIGLLLPRLRRVAGLALVAFFIAVLPANIHAARADITLRGQPATPLAVRVPLQVLFIALTWWSAVSRQSRS